MQDAGVALYAISYDDPEALHDFAEAHGIEYPLVADPESNVIEAFGILNTLVPEEEAEFRGMPFPGTYVVDGDGVVIAKFFEKNQIFRPGPEQLLRAALGEHVEPEVDGSGSVGEVEVRAYLDGPHLVPGLVRELVVEFAVPAGQHLYGDPVPEGLVATSVELEDDPEVIVRPAVFPPTRPHDLVTGERLHVFEGAVRVRVPITVRGALGRAQDGSESEIGIGARVVRGVARFQACDDLACGLPRSVPFEVEVEVKPAVIGDFGGAPGQRVTPMDGRRHMRNLLDRRQR